MYSIPEILFIFYMFDSVNHLPSLSIFKDCVFNGTYRHSDRPADQIIVSLAPTQSTNIYCDDYEMSIR